VPAQPNSMSSGCARTTRAEAGVQYSMAAAPRKVRWLGWFDKSQRRGFARYSARPQLALRGYDAVHLASAAAIADDRTVMVTADRHVRTAARDLSLGTANLPG
jgi:hypothetical protein